MPLPNEIQSGRLNAILHKLLGITEGAPAPSLAPDLFSMLALEVDRPEWKFLAGERLACSGYSLSAGGAGAYSTHVLWNPAGSGVLAVVEWVHNFTNTVKLIGFRANVTEPSGAGYASAGAYRGLRDFRYTPSPTAKPSLIHYYLATASPIGINVLFQWYAAAGATINTQQFVLVPGTGLSVVDGAANADLKISFMWRERPLEASETR